MTPLVPHDQSEKIDLSKLSVAVSVKIDSADRLRNLGLVIRYFQTFFTSFEVIIVEQADGEPRCAELVGDGVRHFLLKTADCHYKPRNLNLAASLSSRPYLMQCDADTFLPPQALKEAIDAFDGGVEFVTPYNGIFVEVEEKLITEDLDFAELLPKLEHFDKLHELRPQRYSSENCRPLYGGVNSDATGGIMLYRREPFFMIGGWNENFVSYGYEDMEMHARIERLGYTLHRLSKYNCYHIPHERQGDSRYNNFQSINEYEYGKICAMPPEALLEYSQRRFREIEFDPNYEFRLVNTKKHFAVEKLEGHRRDLSTLSTIIVIDGQNKGQPILGFTNVLEYLEEYFNGYEIIVVEIGTRRFKYLPNRKNVVYRWMPHGKSIDEAIELGVSAACREEKDVYVIDGSVDAAGILARYKERLEHSVLA